MMLFFYLSTLAFLWYGYQLFLVSAGWKEIKKSDVLKNDTRISISIIIPFRATNSDLLKLIRDLKTQFNEDELILVYDGEFSPNVEYEFIQNRGFGKKAAITTGVEAASHDWVLVLDDDVKIGSAFLTSWKENLKSSEAYLVGGLVHLKSDGSSWIQKFQEIEYTTLQVVAMGLIQKRKPKLISAANMAFKKSAFKDVDGFSGNDHIASGDDVFLLMKILSAYGAERIGSNTLQRSTVTTHVKETVKEAFQQKKRWTGKIENYPNKSIQRWSKAIGMVNLMTACWMVMALFDPLFWILVGVKILLDVWIFNKGNNVFNGTVSKWMLLTSGLVYPWYVIGLIVASFKAKKKELKAPSELKW